MAAGASPARISAMQLDSRRIDVSALLPSDIDAMYALFARHYDNADRRRFEADLARKQWVIQVLEPATGRLCGFSTQTLLNVCDGGQSIHAVYSGDTIVDPACWSESALVREWGRLAIELIAATRPAPLYWFLISKGYKTYRFLPVFFREFFPRHDRPTPRWASRAIDALGRRMFANAYDVERGLVRASPKKDRLRQGVADLTAKRLKDPHVRFFLKHNPGHADGDELCCLARLDVANFTPAGIRLLDPEHRPIETFRRKLSGIP